MRNFIRKVFNKDNKNPFSEKADIWYDLKVENIDRCNHCKTLLFENDCGELTLTKDAIVTHHKFEDGTFKIHLRCDLCKTKHKIKNVKKWNR